MAAAEEWLCRSALSGFSSSMRLLADLYHEEARRILESTVVTNESRICKGNMFLNDARQWYLKWGESNPDPSVWVELGLMLENGRLFESNYDNAAEWYHKAAKEGNLEGLYRLALLLCFDMIEEPNHYEPAIKYAESAANKSYPDADHLLTFIRQTNAGSIE